MGEWRGTGHRERIDPAASSGPRHWWMDREVAEATRRREHYWYALVGFKVSPPIQQDAILDHESMRQPPLVGCYICEQAWEPGIGRRCPGDPS